LCTSAATGDFFKEGHWPAKSEQRGSDRAASLACPLIEHVAAINDIQFARAYGGDALNPAKLSKPVE
jgi:hypothetical protein